MAENKKAKGRFSKLAEVEKALRAKEESSAEFLPKSKSANSQSDSP
ncbi:MAG: hypothetical protein GX039_06575 [Clostridia bacterium]|nr:hypothetical protein [Clostridia bacterium]